jgi:hypothetical protein
MKKIPLTQGKFALVDDEDYEYLNEMSWHAWYNKNGDSFYAHHSTYRGRGESPGVVRMHRLIMKATNGKIKVDHIDGNTLNNQKHNLRMCESHQNNTNMLQLRSDNSTGYRGVSKYFYNGKKKWTACLSVKGKKFRLGYFDSPESAAHAFDKAAKELYGEFCGKLNFE